jgi:subtilisin family serine protease
LRSLGAAALIVAVLGVQGAGAHPSHLVADPGVAAALARHGSAKVMVVFRAQARQRSIRSTVTAVRAVRNRILAEAGNGFRATARWDAVNAVPGWITKSGLARLASDPDVERIGLDVGGGHAADAESTTLIHADQAQALGFTGSGVTVGILDSGVDVGHPDLQANVVGQHCVYDCAGGPDSAQDDNGHGTNVSGIIASKGTVAPIGIAPAAKLVMVKMLDQDASYPSPDQVIDSLNWLALNRPDVKVVNMSIVSTQLFSGYCDSATAWTAAFSSAVASLHSKGVTLFAAAGNNETTSAMAAPACIRDVVAVGAVYDSAYGSDQVVCTDASAADRVTCFSDSSPALDVLAPGALITSTGLRSNGSLTSTYLGTSQASPHAAGAAAILLQARPGLTPEQVEAVLKGSGRPIADWRNGRVTPRIDVLAALNLPLVPHSLTITRSGGGAGSVTSTPAGIACGATCSHTFTFGTSVTLVASAQAGSQFRHWSGACSGTGQCAVTMGADQQVTATFVRVRCVVPNVRGKTLAAAGRAIRKGHCRVGRVTRAFSSVRNGRVISESPRPGRILRAGATVALKVSRGPRRA